MHRLVRIAMLILAALAVVLPAAGCFEDKFAVGDCVTAKIGFGNDKIDKADCHTTSIQDKLNDNSVYRVTKVLALHGRCPRSSDVQFNDERVNATYCLTEY